MKQFITHKEVKMRECSFRETLKTIEITLNLHHFVLCSSSPSLLLLMQIHWPVLVQEYVLGEVQGMLACRRSCWILRWSLYLVSWLIMALSKRGSVPFFIEVFLVSYNGSIPSYSYVYLCFVYCKASHSLKEIRWMDQDVTTENKAARRRCFTFRSCY